MDMGAEQVMSDEKLPSIKTIITDLRKKGELDEKKWSAIKTIYRNYLILGLVIPLILTTITGFSYLLFGLCCLVSIIFILSKYSSDKNYIQLFYCCKTPGTCTITGIAKDESCYGHSSGTNFGAIIVTAIGIVLFHVFRQKSHEAFFKIESLDNAPSMKNSTIVDDYQLKKLKLIKGAKIDVLYCKENTDYCILNISVLSNVYQLRKASNPSKPQTP
jgi:hypothetical protein